MPAMSWTDLNSLSTEELRVMNSNIVAILKTRSAETARTAAEQFRPGQIVQLVSGRTGRPIGFMRIERFNTKTVSGPEVTKEGQYIGIGWRAHPSLLRAV